MTFEKMTEEAKKKQLESRMLKDAVFIILGITFLVISIVVAINDDKKNKDSKKEVSTKTTTVIKK